jgi:SAM-dependent methyltransferase
LCLRCGASLATAAPSPTVSAHWRCPQCGFEPENAGGLPLFAPEIAGGGEGYDPAHFAELARLEAANFWFRARNRLIVWALARYFPGTRSFFEVGCGTGFVLSGIAQAFPGMRLTGAEAASAALAFAARRVPQASLLQMDARRIPFRAEFDAVAAFDVIEHVPDDAAVLAGLRSAVVPGGGVLITVPHHRWLWSEFDVRVRHVRRYSRRELLDKVTGAGLEVLRMTAFVSVLLPLMLLSRLRQRRPAPDYDPLAELRMPPWLDWPLERALDFERCFIRAGASLPAGGSLLLVARRPR